MILKSPVLEAPGFKRQWPIVSKQVAGLDGNRWRFLRNNARTTARLQPFGEGRRTFFEHTRRKVEREEAPH